MFDDITISKLVLKKIVNLSKKMFPLFEPRKYIYQNQIKSLILLNRDHVLEIVSFSCVKTE